MKKILITGANGFIGSACLRQLSEKNIQIHAISRKLNKNYNNVIWHQIDIFEREAIDSLISDVKPSHLLHMAWNTEPGKYWTAKNNFEWVTASLSMLDSFNKNGGQRVVVAGSCAEYDWSYDTCLEYSTPTTPSTVYGVCKNSLQAMLSSYSKEYGLSSSWGRVFFVFGPGEHPSRLFPSVINALLKDELINCSSGEQIRDFMHVDDVASAFISLLNSNINGPVNIASGEGIKIKDVIIKIEKIIGNKKSCVKLGALLTKDEPKALTADISRLRNELGWRPSMSFDDALINTIEWWKMGSVAN